MFDKAIDNLDKILQVFNVETVEYINRFQGVCPIHEGDNKSAFCVYKESGAWRCFSKGCHEKCGAHILGLVRCLLSKEQQKPVTKDVAVTFLEKLLNAKLDMGFAPSINNYFLQKYFEPTTTITREKIRKRLDIPAEYFIGRGFSAAILDKYDVGLCCNKQSRFNKRCVVPIYDINYNYMIGCTGRDITEKSKIKWLHSSFPRETTLYNSWFAKSYIKQTNTCVLVESPGNVWRLEEAGIHCGLGVFGTQLSFGQMRFLSQLGILNIILLLDNDEAGKKATVSVVKKLKGLYNIVVPKITYQDVAECPIEYLKQKISPVLKEL